MNTRIKNLQFSIFLSAVLRHKQANFQSSIKKTPQGIALLLVVIFMFSLSVMAIAFSTMVNVGLRQTNINLLDLKFLYTAEAGIEKTIWYLRQGNNLNNISEELEGLKYQTKITLLEANKYNISSKVFKENRGLEINVQIIKDLQTNNVVLVAGSYNKKFIKEKYATF